MSGQQQSRLQRGLRAVQRFAVFFELMSFVVTCCMILFLETMSSVTGWRLEESNIKAAAIVTFGNVVLLSLICVIIDAVRRQIFVVRAAHRG